jgi:hypothetical protein
MMPKTIAIVLFGALFVCTLVAFSTASSTAHLGQTQTVNGLTVYLGVLSAKVLRQHPDRYPYHEQAKVPSGRDIHHVMLALFDKTSGKRITDAVVKAWVAPLALGGPTKPLDPTLVAGELTYCNYFRISPLDTTVIQAEIRRPDVASVTRARFVLERQPE